MTHDELEYFHPILLSYYHGSLAVTAHSYTNGIPFQWLIRFNTYITGMLIRFKDLSRLNLWLDEATNLHTHPNRITISSNLPPVIRPLKTEPLQA